jgi:hypothetical protein
MPAVTETIREGRSRRYNSGTLVGSETPTFEETVHLFSYGGASSSILLSISASCLTALHHRWAEPCRFLKGELSKVHPLKIAGEVREIEIATSDRHWSQQVLAGLALAFIERPELSQ